MEIIEVLKGKKRDISGEGEKYEVKKRQKRN